MTLSLVIKSAIFGAALWLLSASGFGWGYVILFLALAIFLYNYHIFNTFAVLFSFLVLLIMSWWLTQTAVGYLWLAPTIIVLASLFYIVLGLKNLTIINRPQWHYGLQAALLYLFFLMAFFNNLITGGILSTLFVWLIPFLLLLEFFRVQAASLSFQRRLLFSWLLALLISQFMWLATLLPIGFIGLANLMILAIFVLVDSTLRYLNKEMTGGQLWKRSLIAGLLAAIILLTSRWGM